MNVKIKMTEIDPNDLRANGEVRLRGNQQPYRDDITTRRDYATAFDADPAVYTYVFGVTRTGKFTLTTVNTATNAEIGKAKTYDVKNAGSELRYFFEVP